MDAIYKHCKAKHFAAEKTQNGEFSSFCHKGKIDLPPMMTPLASGVCQTFVLEKYCPFKKL